MIADLETNPVYPWNWPFPLDWASAIAAAGIFSWLCVVIARRW